MPITTHDEPFFLKVERSVTGRRWLPRLADSRAALTISQRHDLPEILGRVLAGRGVLPDDALRHLNPTLRELMPQALNLTDLERGGKRLAAAIRSGERIGLIGDYDVDGVTSAALLIRFLRDLGRDAEVHIPDRLIEGYGPNRTAIESLHAKGVSLLITLDCGVMAHDPQLRAAELGMDVLVVDHHQAGETLPACHALINPNRLDDLSGLGFMSAAGVTMCLVASASRTLREEGWYGEKQPPDLLQFLDLVALGTICDVVPLLGLNRAFVTQGLKVLANRSRVGLAALADTARLKRRPDTHAAGFLLGPRLNAAGRVGHARKALQLLLTEDRGEAMALSMDLERLNRERQEIEWGIIEQAVQQAEDSLGLEARLSVLVVAGEGWHPGVLGLVAARLKEKYNLPSIAIGFAPGSSLGAGSGRSISGVDMGAAVKAAADQGILVKGGGHAMAAGLTIDEASLGRFRAFMEERLSGPLANARMRNVIAIDGALSARAASLDLLDLLERAGPFGTGNPSPVFAFPAHRVIYADGAGTDHVRCTVESNDGAKLKAIAFRALSTPLGELLLSERQLPLHIAGRLAPDDWNGARQVQLMIDDVAELTGT
jgi:single-stranded-DNA-specific exonuclease